MRLNRNYIYNFGANLAPAIVSLISVPYLYKAIGSEEYGILSLIVGLLSYLALFDFGVGRVITQYVAKHEKNDSKKIGGVVIGLSIAILISLIGLVLTYGLGDWIVNVLIKPSENLKEQAYNTMKVCAFFVPPICLASFFKGVLEGCEKFNITALIRVFSTSFTYGLPILVLAFDGGNLATVVKCMLVVKIVELISLVVAAYKLVGKWKWSGVKFESILIVKRSFWMSVSNIISPAMVLSDRFYISWAMGASWVSLYTIPMDLLLKFLVIPASITSAAYPKLAKEFSESSDKFQSEYNKVRSLVNKIVIGSNLLLAAGIYEFINIWIGQDFANEVWLTSLILIVGLTFNALSQVPYNGIQSLGMIRTTTNIHIIELMLYVPAMLVFGGLWGLHGVAIAWSLRCACDFLILSIMLKKYFVQKA